MIKIIKSMTKLCKLEEKSKKQKNIMKENVQKIMERQQNLDELVERAQRLEAASDEYVKCAVRIQRKAHWRHYAVQYSMIGATAICTVFGLVWTFV
ncbi:unnamed protein product [Caenorhabditis angaria]|uniref:V-SNARE coiled-coil homology domain-containing protein n=1 Tax=Caenorhabditis angaria TaxID=860376 RepID=A0A9P1N1W9_9PELO|nr:unnamed protein product [Caenorhabditis angaria]